MVQENQKDYKDNYVYNYHCQANDNTYNKIKAKDCKVFDFSKNFNHFAYLLYCLLTLIHDILNLMQFFIIIDFIDWES